MIVSGALMGFSPQQVYVMTIQDFSAIAQGYSEAHGGKKPPTAVSNEELVALGIEGA